ncbi:MAG: LCP family protein [Clostridioides sp.]|jgi:LCP family protein required for cell wall assembly|nr:LCP family protein [Clostridioides sp.]
MSKLKKFVICLVLIVVLFPVGVFGYFFHKFGTIHDSSMENATLNSLDHKNVDGITNVLLMGVDARPGEGASRSDAMMILTIDTVHKSIKLTSLARDSYVNIPGHGYEKLTHANAYGKAELLIKTIEDNFELDINYYATVDFDSFMAIIDTMDGVTVDVKKSYINEMNKFIPETYKWDTNKDKGQIKYIQTSGEQLLNGYQALAFARIRHNDTTANRDERQREVMKSIMTSFKDQPVTSYPKLVKSILPYVKTNMKPAEIMGLGADIVKIGNFDVKQYEFPITDDIHSKGGIYGNAGWVLRYDKDTLVYLHDFIFNDVDRLKQEQGQN